MASDLKQLRAQLSALLKTPPAQAGSLAGRTFAVYGAGGFGRYVGKMLKQAGAEVAFYIDAKPKKEFPWPVYTLAQATAATARPEVVIGIYNYAVDIIPIHKALTEAGFGPVWTPVQFFNLIADFEPPPQYWLATWRDYVKNRDEILRGFDYFEDDSSRQLYYDLWRYRLTGVIGTGITEQYTWGDQYFSPELPPWPKPLRFIDCGAYTGDTLQTAKKKGIAMEAIAAFEPDLANYAKLVAVVRDLKPKLAFTAPCGVFGSSSQVSFSAGDGTGSAISAGGTSTIQCVTLDEVMLGFHPNLIKMDIEGAEYDALLGGAKLIEQDRPGLAICVYHTPDHIWQIPKLVRKWDLGYRLHLLNHAHHGFETVMYAIPR